MPENFENTDWFRVLKEQTECAYWNELQDFINEERQHSLVFPPANEVFNALLYTSLAQTKVVILGQDPYHQAGQAHGLCFSVRDEIPIPASLRNIFKELKNDLGFETPKNGNLERWAAQGVLLLNSTLTVRAGTAGSHYGKGWEIFTDAVIREIDAQTHRVVFILWGNFARKKKVLIQNPIHAIIESVHPSPLSAHNGFFGHRPFSRANSALTEVGIEPIDWRVE